MRKDSQTDDKTKITQTLELSDRDFKETIIKNGSMRNFEHA